MSDSADLETLNIRIHKLILENVSSGDFYINNFKPKLEFFLDHVYTQFGIGTPKDVLSRTIKKQVSALTRAGLSSNGNTPEPHQLRIWVSTFYTHYMLDKSFRSRAEIAAWVAASWPSREATKGDLDDAWSIVDEYSSTRQSRNVKQCKQELHVRQSIS